jgi:hypothetical protein
MSTGCNCIECDKVLGSTVIVCKPCYEALKDKVDRYEKALKDISDDKLWTKCDPVFSYDVTISDCYYKCIELAKQALEGKE